MFDGTPLPALPDDVSPDSSLWLFMLGYLIFVMLLFVQLPEGTLKRLAFGNPPNSEKK